MNIGFSREGIERRFHRILEASMIERIGKYTIEYRYEAGGFEVMHGLGHVAICKTREGAVALIDSLEPPPCLHPIESPDYDPKQAPR